MTYLLDVSALIALLWQTHVHNQRVESWQSGQPLAVCPLTELGFLRIMTQPAFGLTVTEARKLLKDWVTARKPGFVPCEIPALGSDPPTVGSRTTDFYLCSLAAKHGMALATLDQSIGHNAAFVIP